MVAKVVKDITPVLSQMAKDISSFPKDVVIKSAQLTIDDLGIYRISVDYEFDSAEFNITERVYGDLSGAVNSVLGHIKEFYDTVHEFKKG